MHRNDVSMAKSCLQCNLSLSLSLSLYIYIYIYAYCETSEVSK